MGNYCPSSYPTTPPFPGSALDEDYRRFVQECCHESPEAYTHYWEYCQTFSLFLQRRSENKHILRVWMELSKNIHEPVPQDWDSLSSQYIDNLCKRKQLTRYGTPDLFPMILGFKVHRLPEREKITWVDI